MNAGETQRKLSNVNAASFRNGGGVRISREAMVLFLAISLFVMGLSGCAAEESPDQSTPDEELITQTSSSLIWETFRISPDSRRVAYAAELDNMMYMIIDGKPDKLYDGVWIPVFSPDSKRVAYIVKIDYKESVVVDGKEGKQYKEVEDPVFSPNSKRVAYIAKIDDKEFVVVDGREGKQYEEVEDLAFSPDSRYVAYKASMRVAYEAGMQWLEGGILVADDAAGAEKPIVSQDKLVAVELVVVDRKEGKQYYEVGSPVFSPNSKRVAYIAKTDYEEEFVVVDGKEEKQYYGVESPVFSPNSKRVAYMARIDDKEFVVVDGKEGEKYDFYREQHYSWKGLLVFSPDSRHVAYKARVNGKDSVVVGGKAGKRYAQIITQRGGRIIFDSPNSLHYLAAESGIIYLVRTKLE